MVHNLTKEDQMTEKWIQGAIKNKGSLHKTLGVPQGKKIPTAQLKKAEHSKNGTTRKRVVLGKTLSELNKK